MPLVNIRLANRDIPTTSAQKAALIAGVTRLMQEVLDKKFYFNNAIIAEIYTDNWGVGGEQVTAVRQRSKGPLQT